MRKLLLAAAVMAAIATPAFAADPAEGDWIVQGGNAKVRIAPCAQAADKLCGVFTWTKDAGAKDKAGKPLLGMTFIRDFKKASPGKWTGGKIYDPDSGKTYDSKFEVVGDGTLKLSGCVLMICQKQTWKRPG